jgi:hypothetical protein
VIALLVTWLLTGLAIGSAVTYGVMASRLNRLQAKAQRVVTRISGERQ